VVKAAAMDARQRSSGEHTGGAATFPDSSISDTDLEGQQHQQQQQQQQQQQDDGTEAEVPFTSMHR
jgi:hypothetical protein